MLPGKISEGAAKRHRGQTKRQAVSDNGFYNRWKVPAVFE